MQPKKMGTFCICYITVKLNHREGESLEGESFSTYLRFSWFLVIFRPFSFTFTFIPKSAQEADVVQNIILMFKTHMSADYAGQGASGTGSMSFPDQFDIEYMHIGKLNPNLNKIATCALTKMDVQYGGDRYVAYEDGVPQTTNLTLNFTEFEIITRELIEAGY